MNYLLAPDMSCNQVVSRVWSAQKACNDVSVYFASGTGGRPINVYLVHRVNNLCLENLIEEKCVSLWHMAINLLVCLK